MLLTVSINKRSRKSKRKKHLWKTESFEQMVRSHGPYELEFKLTHTNDNQKSIAFDVIAFAPPGLQIPEEHLDPAVTLGSIKSYIRKLTPILVFSSTEQQSGSELEDLQGMKEKLLTHQDENNYKLLNKKLKLYASSYRKFIKQKTNRISRLANQLTIENMSSTKGEITEIINATVYNWKHYRIWYNEIQKQIDQKWIQRVYTFIDQYISDQFCLFLVRSFENLLSFQESFKDIRNEILNHLSRENIYRDSIQAPLFIYDEKSVLDRKMMSSHLYTHSLSKKYVDSLLYLKAHPEPVSTDSHWFAAFAAFLAMAIYLIALVTLQKTLDLAVNTMLWILLAIFLYIIKDRIKEWIRLKLKSGRKKKLAHRTLVIEDDDQQVGQTYEKLFYPSRQELPKKLINMRYSGPQRQLEKSIGQFEHIQYYQKILTLKSPVADDKTLVEIIRMDINSWLSKADGARQPYKRYDQTDGQIKAEKIQRTYHFHFLIRFTETDLNNGNFKKLRTDQGPWEHIKVIASRDRILEIQSLASLS